MIINVDDWNPVGNITLTEEQLDAVKNTTDNISIIAGPGTGKTEILAQKATYLLQTGECKFPHRILTLCYKVDAATNIKERVKMRCPKELSRRFVSMTIDAFLISLIRRFPSSLPKWMKIRSDFTTIDEIDSVDYSRHSNKNFPDEYTRRVDILEENPNADTKSLYSYAIEQNLFDFKMCHTMAYYIIKHNSLLRNLISKTYKYIFLDEFQDMSNRHYDIIKMLFAHDNNIVTAVGDYKQSIMGFAGAIPDVFNLFDADFRAQRKVFSYNYRSTSQIVSFINHIARVMDAASGQSPVLFQSRRSENLNSFVSKNLFDSIDEEALFIAKSIIKIKQLSPLLSFGDFAIIIKQRAEDYYAKIKDIFYAHEINVRNEDKKISNGIKIQDLMDDKLSRLIIGLIKLKIGNIQALENKEVNDLLFDIFSLNAEKPKDVKKVNRIKNEIIMQNFTTVDCWIDIVFDKIPRGMIKNRLYNGSLGDFNKASKSISWLLQQCLEETGDIKSAISRYQGDNTVKILTTHKSKGLEFDTVFFADVTNDSWWSLSRNKAEAIRCLYVGASRAKNRLFFTTSKNSFPNDINLILESAEGMIRYNPD